MEKTCYHIPDFSIDKPFLSEKICKFGHSEIYVFKTLKSGIMGTLKSKSKLLLIC